MMISPHTVLAELGWCYVILQDQGRICQAKSREASRNNQWKAKQFERYDWIGLDWIGCMVQ